MASNTYTYSAGKYQLKKQFQSAGVSKSTFRVDTTGMVLFKAADTDAVTVADVPKGTGILGVMTQIVTPGTNANTCTAVLSTGTGTALTGSNDMLAAAGTCVAGAQTANAYVAAADTTLVLTFDAGTTDNTVNPVVDVTVFFIA